MRRKRQPSLRGSVRQNTVRMREPDSIWSSFMFRLGALGVGLLVLLTIGIMAVHNGWPHRAVEHVANAGLDLTKKAQFAVKDIVVEGRSETSKDAVLSALDVSIGSPILGFEPKAAQARLAKLPWVANATVERRLPDTILVHLTERTPMARWQRDNRISIIDTNGSTLTEASVEKFGNLPLVVGNDAPGQTKALLENLRNFPDVANVTMAAVRVGERRWDLHLQPNIIARLPERDVDDALGRLSKLISEKKILERNLKAVDLRQPDRITFEPAAATPDDKNKKGDAKL